MDTATEPYTPTATGHATGYHDWQEDNDVFVVFGASRRKLIPWKSPVVMGKETYSPPSEFSKSVRREWAALLHHAGVDTLKENAPTNTTNGTTAEHEALKTEIYGLFKTAGADNWDGEGALAVTREIVSVAQKFVDKLPSHLGRPDVSATPQGEVDFDWIINADVMLTVSIGASNEIAFAGLFHGARLNGREPWTGVVPHFVDCCFKRLHASLGE